MQAGKKSLKQGLAGAIFPAMSPRFTLLVFAFLLGLPTGSLRAADTIANMDAAIDSILINNTASSKTTLSPLAGQTLNAPLQQLQAQALRGLVTTDQTDKKAKVYEVTGNVRFAQKGSSKWEKATKDLLLEEGSVLLTGKDGTASVTFDDNYQNVTHIPENTRAVFRSIEPTDVHLEDGTLYNFFDGLPEGSKWKVSTPTAVAAVRGTHFLTNYTASNGQVVTAVFDVPEDGHKSIVRLIDILPNGDEGFGTDIGEGFQIDLKAGEQPSDALLEEIDPKWIAKMQKFLESLAVLRASGLLPATGGEANAMEEAIAKLFSQAMNFNPLDQVQDLVRGFNLSPSDTLFIAGKEEVGGDRREAFRSVYNEINVREAIQNLRSFFEELHQEMEIENDPFINAVLQHLYNEGVIGTYNHPDVQATVCDGERDCTYNPEQQGEGEGQGEGEYEQNPHPGLFELEQGAVHLHEDLEQQLREAENVSELPTPEQVGASVFTAAFQTNSGEVSIAHANEAFEGMLNAEQEIPKGPEYQGPTEGV